MGAITAPEVRPFGEFRAKSYTPFAEGDVLLAKITPCMENGKAALARGLTNKLGFGSTEFHVFRPTGAILPEYLHHYVRQQSFRDDAQAHMAGTAGQLRVPADYVRTFEIPLPPLAEQKRIVAKVEELLERVNAAWARLARLPAILKRFRQSVLAAACSGQLTADWREGRHSPEPSEVLLDRLLQKRKENWTSVWSTKYKQPSEPDRSELSEHPDTWTLASMDQLTLAITSGSRAWSKYYGRGSGTFLMAQNVRPGRLDLSFRQAVDPPSDDRDRVRSQVQQGDLLVTIVGANTGDVCPVPEDLPEHYVCQSVSLMRPTDVAISGYLNLWLNSPMHGRQQYERYIYGEGRPHLSFDHLRMTPVAIPPLDEQREIVRRVEALLALADGIEAHVRAATVRAERLPQSVLARAFRGELVPTEAELARAAGRDYEPASVLLV